MHIRTDRGIAMITTLLVLMLMSALLVGFTVVVTSDQRYRFIDRDRGQSFYAASGAIEKLTADLGNLFLVKVAPTAADVAALTTSGSQPAISGITYASPAAATPLPSSSLSPYYCVAPKTVVTMGTSGYTIQYCGDAAGNPTTSTTKPISTGPFAGLIALQTPYQLDVTAKTSAGGEVHLTRTIETVAIPVFQFGIFSEVDLSFSAAANFGFGGRVHTNGNLFLAQTAGTTLTLPSQVTAVKEVVRQQLSNGVSIDAVNQTGTVSMATSSTTFRPLLRTEGSVTLGPASSFNEPTWHTISLSTYNSYIRNSRTGAKPLNLPLIKPGIGGTPIDIIRRPAPGEDTVKPLLYGERLYSKASLRILLSDTAADITNLPGVTGAPVFLDGNWNTAYVAGVGGRPAGAAAISSANPPLALSPGVRTATVSNAAGGTITFANAAAALPFKPTFVLAGSANVVTCTGKTTAAPWQLTGCTGVPAMPVTAAGTLLTALSPAGGASGASAATNAATTAASTTLTFATSALLNVFNPLPFWDSTADIVVTCTGYTTTTYTGCSSNPANNTVLTSGAMSDAGTGLIGGWIKIDRGNADGTWTDVTLELLNYGIGAPNQTGGGVVCGDPTPNAIVRLQRLRDNAGAAGGACNYNTDATGAKDPTNWWPNALFDAREGVQRDSNYPGANNLTLGGIMYYVGIDAGNLAKWFRGQAPYSATSGPLSRVDGSATGYTLYFSDRRNNRDAGALETAEYGWEDFVNPGVANGVPNGVLDAGEDVNGNGTLEVYGGVPNYTAPGGAPTYNAVPPCAACVGTYGAAAQPASTGYVLTTAARPTWRIPRRVAQSNRPILFRRALVLTNGAVLGSDPTAANRISGLTVVSENPVYIRGDWNATATFAANDLHAATAVIADAVTVLSNLWNDNDSFSLPWDVTAADRARPANSYYRVAIISGKGPIFPKPGDVAAGSTFGTDGGAHSFLRMLEGDAAGGTATVNYRGSMATLYYNRQAIGPFKCCGAVVYSVPTRNYIFDADFLNPLLLPPNTPAFRDMNSVGFSQDLRAGK